MAMIKASRNKREGRYVGKHFRRQRRGQFDAVGSWSNPGPKKPSDSKPTREERRYRHPDNCDMEF